jgi:hypothetical protein
MEYSSPVSPSQRTTSPEESAFSTSGVSASSGRLSSTREIRSRMSSAAASRSRDRANSTVTRERPSSLDEEIVRIPSTPTMRSSIICVMRVSTTAAEAPGPDT